MLPKAEVCYFIALYLNTQLSDLQTPQGQLLNNFISGSAGGFIGTVLNTPYVRPFTSGSAANSFPSSLPVSTSAAGFFECSGRPDSHHNAGCQVSHSGNRETTRCCPEIQLDISCVRFLSVEISWHDGDRVPCRLITIFREEGAKALYKGFVPKVLRLAPGGGVLLLVVEFTLGVFRNGTFLLNAFVKAHLLMTSLLSVGPTIYLR